MESESKETVNIGTRKAANLQQPTANNSAESPENVKVEKKKKISLPILIAIIAVAAVIVAAGIVGRAAYVNSNGYQGQKALALGNQYLGNQDYENALIEFKKAFDFANSPESALVEFEKKLGISVNKAKITEDVSYGILTIEDVAMEYGNQGDFTSEAELIDLILKYFPEDEKAVEIKDEVDAFGKLFDLCEASDWEGVLTYLDSDAGAAVKNKLESVSPVLAKRNVALTIGKNGNAYYVITQDVAASAGEGNGVGVISAAKTYSVYEGEWKGGVPDGKGMLNIWYKNSDRSSSYTYTGNFKAGKADGSVEVASNDVSGLSLTTGEGIVSVVENVDNRGLLTEKENGWAYVAKNYSASGNTIDGYSLEVPGFGSSDDYLEIEYACLDNEPPVFDVSFIKKGGEVDLYSESNNAWEGYINKRLTAYDEVDGDVTDKITHEVNKHANAYGENYPWSYAADVTYTVTDNAGNTATLIISFGYYTECGDTYIYDWDYVIQ